MTLHFMPNDNIQVGDTVHVNWGRFGGVTAKVVKVMPDGGLMAARYNKSRGEYANLRRFYKNASGKGWHGADASDPSLYGGHQGARTARIEFVCVSEGEEVVNVYKVGGRENGQLIRTITGAEAASLIGREVATPA